MSEGGNDCILFVTMKMCTYTPTNTRRHKPRPTHWHSAFCMFLHIFIHVRDIYTIAKPSLNIPTSVCMYGLTVYVHSVSRDASHVSHTSSATCWHAWAKTCGSATNQKVGPHGRKHISHTTCFVRNNPFTWYMKPPTNQHKSSQNQDL